MQHLYATEEAEAKVSEAPSARNGFRLRILSRQSQPKLPFLLVPALTPSSFPSLTSFYTRTHRQHIRGVTVCAAESHIAGIWRNHICSHMGGIVVLFAPTQQCAWCCRAAPTTSIPIVCGSYDSLSLEMLTSAKIIALHASLMITGWNANHHDNSINWDTLWPKSQLTVFSAMIFIRSSAVRA